MPRNAQPLAPIVKTEFAPSLRTGRVECWAASTTDGKWDIQRLDGVSGTPWQVIRTTDGAHGSLHGTLRSARQSIASGWEDTRADEYMKDQRRHEQDLRERRGIPQTTPTGFPIPLPA